MTAPSTSVAACWADVTDETDGVKQLKQLQNIDAKSASADSASVDIEEAESPTGDIGPIAGLPSVGSRLHSAGRCKPCAFYRTKECANGNTCSFCHLCPPYEKQRRKRLKQQLLENMLSNMDGRSSSKFGGGQHTHSRQNSSSSVTSSTMTPSSGWDNMSIADPFVEAPWLGSARPPVAHTMPPRRMNPTRLPGPPYRQQRSMQSQRQRPQPLKALAHAHAHRMQGPQPPQPQWGNGGMWVPMAYTGTAMVQPQMMQPMMYVPMAPGTDPSAYADRAWATVQAQANAQQKQHHDFTSGDCGAQQRLVREEVNVGVEDGKDSDEDDEDEEDSEDDSPAGRASVEEQGQQVDDSGWEDNEPRSRAFSKDEPNGVIDEDDEEEEDEDDSEDDSPAGRDAVETQRQQDDDNRRHYRRKHQDEEEEEEEDSEDEDEECEDDEEEEEE